MGKLKEKLRKIKESFSNNGFIGIETVIIGAVVVGGAVFMGVVLRNAGDDSRDESLVVMSDNTSYDSDAQIANLVEQILFYRRDSISMSDPKFDGQAKLTAVQIPVGGHLDILAGVFPASSSNKKLQYKVSVNPDVLHVSDYGLASNGYPMFRIEGRSDKAGYAQVRACATDGSHVCSTLNVTVGMPASGITSDKSKVILNVDRTTSIDVSPIPENATVQDITWEDTNGKLKNISYNPASNKLSITGKEAGTTTLVLTLTDEPFGGTVYKKEIEVIVRDGINGVVIEVDNPIAEEDLELNWALHRAFTVRAINTTNLKIEKFQYYISDEKITDLDKVDDTYNWKDYANGSSITETGRYIYFRACQAEEDVQDYNGESLCGRAFRFVLAVDTTSPLDSSINTYRKDKNGNIPTLEADLNALGIAKLNGKGEYVTTQWDKSALFDIVTKQDNHSGFAKIEYQLGNAKEETIDENKGDISSINDENADWGTYSNGVWAPNKWLPYTNKTVLTDSAWRIRFRVCDKLGNCRSLGSRPYLVDNEDPLSFKVEGVTTQASNSWATSRTITLSEGKDRHSGVKYYNYCVKNALDDKCEWNLFTQSGASFGYEGRYIMFQAVDDVGNTYSDGKNYVLNIENSKPKILGVTGEASAVNSWATQRQFTIDTSTPLSVDLTFFYQYSDSETSGYGNWVQVGGQRTFTIKNTGKYVKFKVCLSHVTSVCSDVTNPYKLFVDTTSPALNSVSGGSTNFAKQRVFTFGIGESHSGVNRIEFATNTSFTDKQTCPDADKTKCTISGLSLKQVYFRVYDNMGNVSNVSAPQNVYIDNSAPAGSGIASGSSTTWAKSRTITFKQSSDNFTGITYKYCASSYEADCNYTTNPERFASNGSSTTVTLSSGTAKYIYVVACDAVGNCSGRQSGNLYIDNTAPTISVSGGSTSWATSRTFAMTMYDTASYRSPTPNSVAHTSGQSQIWGYQYYIQYNNGSNSGWQSYGLALGDGNTSNQTWGAKWNNAKYIWFRAQDYAGNIKETGQYNIYIQSTFSISGTQATSWSNADRSFSLSSTCNGTTTYSFSDDWGYDSGTGTWRTFNVNSGHAYWSVNVSATCNGMSASTTVNVYVDKKPPNISTNVWYSGTTMGNWRSTGNWSWNVSDGESGINWNTAPGGQSYTPCNPNDCGNSITPSISKQGCVYDNAGNYACSSGTAYNLTWAYKPGKPAAVKDSSTQYRLYRNAYVVNTVYYYAVSTTSSSSHPIEYECTLTAAQRSTFLSSSTTKLYYFTDATSYDRDGGPKGLILKRGSSAIWLKGKTASIQTHVSDISSWS